MAKKRCVACGSYFQIRPQVPHQSYCSAPECQRERRQEWQRCKLESDVDHRDNKARAQQAWALKNPNYWRQYRETHPDYVASNRSKQRDRNLERARQTIAKTDALTFKTAPLSGLYELKVVNSDHVAKMDVWLVEITTHACEMTQPPEIVKTGRDR